MKAYILLLYSKRMEEKIMNYLKKMCILRQVKQGFSGDGKTLSGLIKVEQYGKNIAIEVSIINFAPLVSGEYYCLISDGKGQTEMLALRGKSLFNILSDIDISDGFCGVICHVKNEIVPIAYGINGNGAYDWKKILNAAMPPSFYKQKRETPQTAITQNEEKKQENIPFGLVEEANEKNGEADEKEDITPANGQMYDDEFLATENYYQEEKNEREQLTEIGENAQTQSAVKNQGTQARYGSAENADAEKLLHPFKTDGDGYYRSVKNEIDELFSAHPRDTTLVGAFSCSEWVRIKGEEGAPQYLVGVVYDDGKAQYICYALAAQDKDAPPEEIRSVCTFVPTTPFQDSKGFFVIFQSAATGECIKPLHA